MIYIYYSLSQKYFFDIKIQQLSNKFLDYINNDVNFFSLDADQCDSYDIVNLCSDSFLFGGENKRVVVVRNAFFFCKKSENKKISKYFDLLKFLKTIIENKNVILFFFVYDDNIDSENIFFKECKKYNAFFEKFSFKEYEWKEKVIKPLILHKKINICDDAVQLLFERTKNNFANLMNEINKLQLYGDYITLELADKIITASIEDNFFYFFNAIIKKEKYKSIKILNDLLSNKQILSNVLLGMLISNFRFLYMCNFLLKNNNNNLDDIAKKLNANKIRVKIFAKNLKDKITDDNIINVLNDLYLIDRKIKKSEINDSLALELFTINYINNY